MSEEELLGHEGCTCSILLSVIRMLFRVVHFGITVILKSEDNFFISGKFLAIISSDIISFAFFSNLFFFNAY